MKSGYRQNSKAITAIILLVGLVLVLPINVLSNSSAAEEHSELQVLPSLNTFEVLPDPELNSTPTVIVNGTSPNFDMTYEQDLDYNTVSLNWNHSAGDNLSFNLGNYQPPKCNEFIYMTQEFDWELEVLPLSAVLNIDYIVELSGDIESQHVMWYVWLIDSSGNWEDFVETYPPVPSQWRIHHQNIYSYEMHYPWGGMIEDETGWQEDPEDKLTFVVGLAPSENFQNHTDTLSGSATLSIREVSLMVTIEVEGDIEREPLKVSTSGIYFQMHGIGRGPDGSTYIVGSESDYDYQDASLVLMKWDSQASVVWTRYIRGPMVTWGHAVAAAGDGSVYTLGKHRSSWGSDEYTTMLAKWSASGSLEWLRTYLGLEEFRINSMCIGSDGGVYGCGSFYNETGYIPSLVKWDAAGNHLWTEEWELAYFQAYQVEASPDGGVYVLDYASHLVKFDVQGNELWEIDYFPYSGFAVDDNGFLYGAQRAAYDIRVARYSPNGHQVWNTSLGDLNMEMTLQPTMTGLDVTTDGTLFVGFLTSTNQFVAKWSSSGQFLEIFTCTSDEWGMFYSYVPGSLSVSSNGLLHIFCQSNNGYAMAVFSDADIPATYLDTNVVGGITAGIASSLGAVVLIVLFTKKPEILHRVKGLSSPKESSEDNYTEDTTDTEEQDGVS